MKKLTKILHLLGCTFLLVQLSSCELLDFDVDSDLAQIAAQMKLNFDTAYVYRGYTLHVIPTFEPDSLNISDVYYTSGDTSVVYVDMKTGRITAVGAGWTKLYVESVSARIQDSCTVCVMDPWELQQEEFPYETVFYADATVKDAPMDSNMVFAAFVGDECRAIGELLEFYGVKLLQFRVGGDDVFGNKIIITPSEDNNDNEEEEEDEEDEENNEGEKEDDKGNGQDEEDEDIWDIFDDDNEGGDEGGEDVEPTPPQKPQTIVFRCYDKKKLKLYEFILPAGFDGATHGTLSNLYKMEFK